MTRQIVIEGSKKEIADQIAGMADRVVRAILWVESNPPNEPSLAPQINAPSREDAWTRDLRQWAAAHRHVTTMVPDDRDSIYADRLQ